MYLSTGWIRVRRGLVLLLWQEGLTALALASG
jgi:hypothetical protein